MNQSIIIAALKNTKFSGVEIEKRLALIRKIVEATKFNIDSFSDAHFIKLASHRKEITALEKLAAVMPELNQTIINAEQTVTLLTEFSVDNLNHAINNYQWFIANEFVVDNLIKIANQFNSISKISAVQQYLPALRDLHFTNDQIVECVCKPGGAENLQFIHENSDLLKQADCSPETINYWVFRGELGQRLFINNLRNQLVNSTANNPSSTTSNANVFLSDDTDYSSNIDDFVHLSESDQENNTVEDNQDLLTDSVLLTAPEKYFNQPMDEEQQNSIISNNPDRLRESVLLTAPEEYFNQPRDDEQHNSIISDNPDRLRDSVLLTAPEEYFNQEKDQDEIALISSFPSADKGQESGSLLADLDDMFPNLPSHHEDIPVQASQTINMEKSSDTLAKSTIIETNNDYDYANSNNSPISYNDTASDEIKDSITDIEELLKNKTLPAKEVNALLKLIEQINTLSQDEFPAYRFTTEQYVQIGATIGGRKFLAEILELYPKIIKFRVSCDQLVRICSSSESDKLTNFFMHIKPLTKSGFSTEQMIDLIGLPGGLKNLATITYHQKIIIKRGFTPEQVIKLFSQTDGAKNLKIISHYYAQLKTTSMDNEEVVNLLSTKSEQRFEKFKEALLPKSNKINNTVVVIQENPPARDTQQIALENPATRSLQYDYIGNELYKQNITTKGVNARLKSIRELELISLRKILPYFFTEKQYIQMASNINSAVALDVFITNCDSLKIYNFSAEQSALIIGSDDGGKILSIVIQYQHALLDLGLDAKNIIKLVEHNGGLKNLIVIIDYLDALKRLNFDSEKIINLLSNTSVHRITRFQQTIKKLLQPQIANTPAANPIVIQDDPAPESQPLQESVTNPGTAQVASAENENPRKRAIESTVTVSRPAKTSAKRTRTTLSTTASSSSGSTSEAVKPLDYDLISNELVKKNLKAQQIKSWIKIIKRIESLNSNESSLHRLSEVNYIEIGSDENHKKSIKTLINLYQEIIPYKFTSTQLASIINADKGDKIFTTLAKNQSKFTSLNLNAEQLHKLIIQSNGIKNLTIILKNLDDLQKGHFTSKEIVQVLGSSFANRFKKFKLALSERQDLSATQTNSGTDQPSQSNIHRFFHTTTSSANAPKTPEVTGNDMDTSPT